MASVEKRTRGGKVRWYARYRDPAGQQRTRTFDRKVDAETFLTTVESSKLGGSYIDPRAGALTVTQFYADWSARQVWTSNTDKAMSLAVRSTTFSAVRLRDLRASHLEQWVKEMDSRGLAAGTVRTRFNNVHSMLRAAVRDRLISFDPAADVRLPRGRTREASIVIPTTAQVGALIEAADASFKPFIALAAFAGLRLGEAAGVQIDDVNFLGRTLHVRRQVQRAPGRGNVEIRAPKYGSERAVYLPDDLVTMLARRIETSKTQSAPSMFYGEHGNPPHQNTVAYWWRAARSQVPGAEDVRFHDLRHYFASGLIAAGCDVVTVQRAFGHKSATTTLATYSHLWPSAEDRTRAASAGLMATALADVYPSRTGVVSDAN